MMERRQSRWWFCQVACPHQTSGDIRRLELVVCCWCWGRRCCRSQRKRRGHVPLKAFLSPPFSPTPSRKGPLHHYHLRTTASWCRPQLVCAAAGNSGGCVRLGGEQWSPTAGIEWATCATCDRGRLRPPPAAAAEMAGGPLRVLLALAAVVVGVAAKNCSDVPCGAGQSLVECADNPPKNSSCVPCQANFFRPANSLSTQCQPCAACAAWQQPSSACTNTSDTVCVDTAERQSLLTVRSLATDLEANWNTSLDHCGGNWFVCHAPRRVAVTFTCLVRRPHNTCPPLFTAPLEHHPGPGFSAEQTAPLGFSSWPAGR